jgi:sulfur-oxidizing protein SoxX
MRSRAFMVAALLCAGVACDSGHHTTAGFRLPADGNIDRGRQAFADLGCSTCHRVPGSEMPAPTVQPPVPVVLGGEVDWKLSDAYIVTSLISPSQQLAHHRKDQEQQLASGGVSRRPSYADRITVRQMVDLVAFLQSRYSERDVLPPENYY